MSRPDLAKAAANQALIKTQLGELTDRLSGLKQRVAKLEAQTAVQPILMPTEPAGEDVIDRLAKSLGAIDPNLLSAAMVKVAASRN
jgi:hypothetical protein